MRKYSNTKLIIVYSLAIVALSILYLFLKNDRATSIVSHIPPNVTSTSQVLAVTTADIMPLFKYIEIINSCGPYFEGTCVNVRSAPNINNKAVTQLRTGVVLKVGSEVVVDGVTWYKITFDEWLRYPTRVSKDWYVESTYTRPFTDIGIQEFIPGVSTSTKRIIIDRSEQKLYAYDGTILFTTEDISSGIKSTPTPRGIFKVYKKTPSRYMQGPIPDISTHMYDLPGVPWDLYFTEQGAVIHGAYWHDHFGKVWSNGCVNLEPQIAKKLYEWADVGTEVLVRD